MASGGKAIKAVASQK